MSSCHYYFIIDCKINSKNKDTEFVIINPFLFIRIIINMNFIENELNSIKRDYGHWLPSQKRIQL